MAYKYPISDVFHWFCKIARFFATEPYIMYNILNVLKSVLEITAYQMKSVINQDIIKAVTDGIESLCNIPVKLFWDCLMEFNRGRNRALRTRLRNI